ncbi:hypothetical protein KRC46_000221 [Neisseria gonorrhoeae]
MNGSFINPEGDVFPVIGVVVWSNGYSEEMKNLAMAGLVLLSFEMLYVSFLIRIHISKLEDK